MKQNQPSKPLTIQEAKDEVARKYKTRQNKELSSWEDAINEYCKGYLFEDVFEKIIHEVILLYHSSQTKVGYSLGDMRKGLEWAIIEASVNGNADYDRREKWISEYLKNHPPLTTSEQSKVVGYSESDLEKMYLLGLLNRESIDMDTLSKELEKARTKIDLSIKFIKSCTPSEQTRGGEAMPGEALYRFGSGDRFP